MTPIKKPWKLSHFEYDPVFQAQTEVRDNAGCFVCRIENCPSPTVAADWQACGLFDSDDPELWERNLANARLIAAAPDLLAALEALINHCQSPRLASEGISRAPRQRDLDAARAAIARTVG